MGDVVDIIEEKVVAPVVAAQGGTDGILMSGKGGIVESIDAKLSALDPITLEEMSGIRLMNRIDTKFLVNVRNLPTLLEMAKQDYYVQRIGDLRKAFYRTLYYDTPEATMYVVHQDGKLNRQKIRVREYVESNLMFLEVKKKNNKGRTSKKRITITDENVLHNEEAIAFLDEKSKFKMNEIDFRLRNSFFRITLVNKEKSERLTIDFNINFENCVTGVKNTIPKLCIVEVKQDGNAHSHFKDYLASLRIKKRSISKYCLGMVLTDPSLKYNRFKEKIRYINKL
ncbi:MAG: polyphosphate polymerase domain-containing protein [Paludibacteraceae bacterium]|nr:polyphosphate polymerase domain-containing protein [Paludibacteraceae bacterium]MBO7608343.1 polyphosphate polymerase domain-containing protein [Paludibacteraceae bacterium]MBP5481832.1 polyphosphate polymerase domain-containing protein [Paludibacteraceae bacterium]